MNYPIHLLPATNYKIIEWTDDLLPLFLIRYDSSKNLFLHGTSAINPDTIEIPTKHLSDLSNNLLGKSEICDIYIKVTNKPLLEQWEEGQSVTIPIFDLDFHIDKERGYYFWQIQDLVSCHFEPIEIITSGKTHSFIITLEIKHTPKKCNFWHFSIITLANNNDVNALQIGENQKKKIWRTAKTVLTNIILTDIQSFSSLHQKHYIKN